MTDIKTLTDIFQNLTIMGATLVAAWWAYATFGLREKNDELLAMARKINEIHSHFDGASSVYGYKKILAALGGMDEKEIAMIKQGAEARFEGLCQELSDLRDLSLRISPVFRVLTIGEHESVLLDARIQGIEHWSNTELKEKLGAAKIKVLNEIYMEMNKHSHFLRWLGLKISNGIFHIRNLGKSIV